MSVTRVLAADGGQCARRHIGGRYVKRLVAPAAALGIALGAALFPQGQRNAVALQSVVHGAPEVNAAVHSDVSPPLRDIRSKPHAYALTEKPFRRIPTGPATATQPDGALQSTAGPQIAVTNALNFAGVGNGAYGFTPNAAPPDTN